MSCIRQTKHTQSGAPCHLIGWTNSRISIQYMDFVEIFIVSLDLSTIYLFSLVGFEPPSCLVVTLSKNAITAFWCQVEYKIVLFYFLCVMFRSTLLIRRDMHDLRAGLCLFLINEPTGSIYIL